MELLIRKAYQFVRSGSGTDMRHLDYLYRTKNDSYWDQIFHNNNSVMYPELKDNNGHVSNPINGRTCGIWLSAFTYREGKIPGFSPFGNQRYHIAPHTLLDPRKFTMFFADFYCHDHRKQHYVTIVVCVRGSKNENMFKGLLPILNPVENSFINVQWHRDGRFSIWSTGKLFVEIYFCAEINLNLVQDGFFKPVQDIGTPIAWSGRKADSKCTVCSM